MTRQHFKTLDGLRGVAALAVLVGHAFPTTFGQSLVPRKLLAVQFFFILSGFVIAYSYEDKLRSGMSKLDFACRRVIRLYPMILIGAALGFLSLLPNVHPVVLTLYRTGLDAANLPDLPCPTCASNNPFPVNPPEWSIFFELIAYALFASFLHRLPNWSLLLLALPLMAAATDAMIVYTDHIPFQWHYADATGSFVLGVLLFRLRRRGTLTVPGLPLPVLGSLLVAACAAPRSLGPAVDVLAVFALFPMLILTGSATRSGGQRLAAHLGDLSFPLYIVHWPVMRAVHRLDLAPATTFALTCALAILAAELALRIDVPLRVRLDEWRRRWWRRSSAP